jgi:hypothetical protein
MRSNYRSDCPMWCPSVWGGVSFFVMFVALVSNRVLDACSCWKRFYHRLDQLLPSPGLAGGGIDLLASDLRTGLPIDLSPPAAITGIPPPILPKSWKRSMPSSLPSEGSRVSRPNRVAASLLSASRLFLLALVGAVVCGRAIGSVSMPNPTSVSKLHQKSFDSGVPLDAV